MENRLLVFFKEVVTAFIDHIPDVHDLRKAKFALGWVYSDTALSKALETAFKRVMYSSNVDP